jgi:AcrR family transcriptional regulator/DNA-binding MarR family transcriptional regulator
MPSTNGGAGTRPRAYPGRDGTGADTGGIEPEDLAAIQRARMLTAMVDEVSERGSANVTVAHVVGRSGVSRRTFYELFADIRDCFLAAFDQTLDRASRYVLDAYDPEADWRERVRAALIALLELVEREPDTGRLLIVDSLGVGAPTLARRQQVVDRIVAVIDEGRALCKPGNEPLELAAEGAVGGVLSVLHTRLLDAPRGGEPIEPPLVELTGPLMSMIVLPYLGQAGARQELRRPVPKPSNHRQRASGDPLRDVDMRLTYRTIRVLLAVGAHPGSSNREVAEASGVHDQGQISKLLTRLESLGLIANSGAGQPRGATNAWALTPKGQEVQGAIAPQSS